VYMKILYDHQAFMQIIGGVSRSYVELIPHLNTDVEYEIALKYSRNIYIKDLLPTIKYPFANFSIPFKRRIIKRINFDNSIERLINSDYDLFHSTFDDAYFLPYLKTPFVITVHDLIPEHDPDNWSKLWLESRKEVFNKASQIVAVSQHTKNDLLYFYPEICESNVTVIHHGYSIPLQSNHGDNAYGDYILYVGSRGGYKNFNRFIEAITPILKNNKGLRLLCTGSVLTKVEQIFLTGLGVFDRVIAKQFDDQTLRVLYVNALVFVFPSLIEGFGIPILEAWGNHCPVALSNRSCFPEIAANAAIYFDPEDTSSIYNAITNILESPSLRDEIVTNGNERLKLFDWKGSAEKLTQVYLKAVNST